MTSRDRCVFEMHTTELPSPVVREAQPLETGTILERMRAAELLATAYADDEARRLAERRRRSAEIFVRPRPAPRAGRDSR